MLGRGLLSKEQSGLRLPKRRFPPLFCQLRSAEVAQLVEQRIRNARVRGSSPLFGSNFPVLGSRRIFESVKNTIRLLFTLFWSSILTVSALPESSDSNSKKTSEDAKSSAISAADAAAIRAFTGGWGKGAGVEAKFREREFAFSAIVAKHNGDWDSLFEMVDGKILSGDLPALLELMGEESKGKIQTGHKNIQAVSLDSDEIFAVKPVFVYFTGSEDFTLSDNEVANLQKYIRLGGAIWGNGQSGGRSAFDAAFRREMRRVMPDENKDFERVSAFDSVFRREPYFADVKRFPEISAMRYSGEIAVLHTTADFSPKNATPKPSTPSRQQGSGDLQWGVNLIAHLLTRWEAKLRASPRS